MNINKFTQKSVEAVQKLEEVAYDYGNQEVTEEHLLYNLINQEDSLILKLLEKMGIDTEAFKKSVSDALEAQVKVQGGTPYIGADLNKALIKADDEAKAMGDEYVSVEHLFLSMLRYPSRSMKKLFSEHNITRDGFLQALSTVRGNQKVTTDNPEVHTTPSINTAKTVEKAKMQKLDPVSEDDEISRRSGPFQKDENNPVMIVNGGRQTAAVKALAQRIARGDVPDNRR